MKLNVAAREFPAPLLYLIFFLSGGAAILYQLLWQRSLFTIYGTSADSVTIIITVFMLGLGLGGLAGGALSRLAPWAAPVLFGVAEVLIGAFGLASIPLIHWIGTLTPGAAGFEVGLPVFALLLLPTLCMGATLPLLVAHAVTQSRNVGRSVGALYFVHTLGASAGCVAGAVLLFGTLGQESAVRLAALVNFVAAACVLATLLRRTARP
jgi:spermidine synthase